MEERGACALEEPGARAFALPGSCELDEPGDCALGEPSGDALARADSALLLAGVSGLTVGENTLVIGLLALLTVRPCDWSTERACSLTPPRPARLFTMTASWKDTTTTSVSVMRGVPE